MLSLIIVVSVNRPRNYPAECIAVVCNRVNGGSGLTLSGKVKDESHLCPSAAPPIDQAATHLSEGGSFVRRRN
jgi:hypothetical protein